LKNFTFKVFPAQSGSENKQDEEVAKNSIEQPSVAKMDALWPETAKKCPPCVPLPPQMPCPPMEPMPTPPQMPCPPMGPMPPQMPCPPMGGLMAPPFTCPYFRLAHSYVPWQNYDVVYNPAEALCKGTLFPELHMPQGKYGPCEGPQPCRIHFGGGVPYGCE
jgi:hypothetical protein